MKQLHPTKLWAVEVPEDAINFRIDLHGIALEYNCKETYKGVLINTGNKFKIIGTITKDEISFDANKMGFNTDNFKRLFRSLLRHNELYFENPLGSYATALKRHILTGPWQEVEQKVIKGKLLILEEI